MDFKYFITIIFLLSCVLTCMVTPALGTFEDGFQNHPSNDIEQGRDSIRWDGNGAPYITTNIITHEKSVMIGDASFDPCNIINDYGYIGSYWSFSVIHCDFNGCIDGPHVYFYDEYMNYMNHFYIRPWMPPENQDVRALYEIVYSEGDMYLYENGVLTTNLGTLGGTGEPAHFRLHIQKGWASPHLKISHTSFDGNIITMGTDENPDTYVNIDSDDIITAFWAVKTIDPYNAWNDSTYQIVTTWLDTGSVVNTTTITDTVTPIGLITYNRSIIMPSPNYGTYQFTLTKDGTTTDRDYLSFVPIGDSGSLSWNKANYVPSEMAKVVYTYSSYTPATYNYYIKTYDINMGLVDTHILSAISGTENILIDGWATGSYYSLLVVEEKSSGDEYSLAFDVFDVTDSVIISGVTYDVTNNVSLGATNINFTQATAWYNTTSNASGNYNLTEFSTDIQITCNASKTGYYHEDFLFTPLVASMYETDLYLFPTIDRLTHAVEGVIIDNAMYQAIPGATVNIWNSTWSNNTISNSLGYYRFDNLWCNSTSVTDETFNTGAYGTWTQLNNDKLIPDSQIVTNISTSFVYFNNTDYLINYTDGSIQAFITGNMTANNDVYINYSYYLPTIYYVNSTADGYDDSTDYNTVVNSWTVQNIPLRAIYSLNITAVDATTGSKIQEFTVTVDGESRDITNGTTTYYKNYGLYTIVVSSEGYYSSQENVIMDRNRDVQLSLIPVDSEYYPSHYVDFIVCSIWGTKYPDVTVNVYNSTDTSGDTLLNGTTGTDGGVTFRMNENVRYTLVFTGGGIVEKTINIYPKNERYYIIVSYDGNIFEDDILESNIIGITVKHYPGINGSVDISYNDISDNTSTLNFTIKERLIMGNFTTIATYDSFTNMSNGEHRFILGDYSDKEFIVIVNYTHAEYGDRQRNFGISYGNNIAVLNDIFGPFVKGMLSVFLLFAAGLVFGAANREIGALLVSLTGVILHSMHWFDYFGINAIVIWAALSLALIVSIAANFGKKGREEGY